MDLPQQPDDLEQKNIIDKLANFVARNGPEFEHMTKTKQKDNAKFSFLFGGEYFNYYQAKVTTERAVIKQQTQQQVQQQGLQASQWQTIPTGGPPMGMIPPTAQPLPGVQHHPVLSITPVTTQPLAAPPQQPTGSLEQQIKSVQQNLSKLQASKDEQIRQSESNLAAQYQNMIQQQGPQIDQCIKNCQELQLQQLTIECGLSMEELDRTVQPIIDSCTKDGILNCKNWIMQKSVSVNHCELITQYLMKRITAADSPFSLRLHLTYLLNDLLHHCMRKGHSELKGCIQKIVIPTFCITIQECEDKGRDKLLKLLNLWERHDYFNTETIELLKHPGPSLVTYKGSLMNDFKDEVSSITVGVQKQYSFLQNQHQEFVNHLNSQVQAIQTQLQLLLQQKANQIQAAAQSQLQSLPTTTSLELNGQTPLPITVLTSTPDTVKPDPIEEGQQIPTTVTQPRRFSRFSQPHPTPPPQQPPPNTTQPPPHILNHPDLSQPPPDFSRPPPDFPPQGFAPPTGGPPPPLPDFSRPPPGFPGGLPAQTGPPLHSGPPPGHLGPPPGPPHGHHGPHSMPPMDLDLTPSVPYYELPAGLMAPLVQLDETEYKPLDPRDIRLPPPMPPTDRLLAAVEAFYGPPSHDRPRDTDGWEKLGLYEFFKAKHRCKKFKQEREAEMAQWGRSEFRARSRSPPPYQRISPRRSRSPSPVRRKYRDGRSHSRERQRMRSASRDRSRSRSRSRERSRSESPEKFIRQRSPQRFRGRSRSRSRSRSRERYISPKRKSRDNDSPLPYQPSSRSPSPSRPVTMKRSISRSPSPPSTMGFGIAAPPQEIPLSDTNKGRQLMLKMGWGGKGLGAAEQGRLDPIEAAEVREKQDQFKGIGVSDFSDPFEQFRKSKAKGYVQRMRARDEMRDAAKKADLDKRKDNDQETDPEARTPERS